VDLSSFTFSWWAMKAACFVTQETTEKLTVWRYSHGLEENPCNHPRHLCRLTHRRHLQSSTQAGSATNNVANSDCQMWTSRQHTSSCQLPLKQQVLGTNRLLTMKTSAHASASLQRNYLKLSIFSSAFQLQYIAVMWSP